MKWNRKRRKALKLARKHGRDPFTARHPCWVARQVTERTQQPSLDALLKIFREVP